MTLPAARRERPGRFAALALAELARRGAAIGVVTVPAPDGAPERFPLPAGPDFLWAPPTGPTVAAAGSVFAIEARGARRFADLRARAGELWRGVGEVRHPEAVAPPPRLLGGFAFAPGAADDPPWLGFGDAAFVLPRASYGSDRSGRAFLRVATDRPGDPREQARVADQIDGLLSRPLRPAADARPRGRLDVAELEREAWRRRVEAIRAAIADGVCEKIVAARRSALLADAPIDPAAVLARLARRHPGCFRFALRRGEATFLGATPERLVSRRRERVETEALAGTVAVGAASAPGAGEAPPPGAALLASGKDRGEQEMVVHAIERALRPLCRDLDIPPEPRVRALRHVLHLETPVRGILRRPTHVLELVEALHPTPAVGGEPTGRALSWIAAEERAGRGWYAGPVGWFDAEGDGEFAVAIRSGLVSERRAWVWAGAGIVEGSDPDAEYEETGLKQRALFEALGAPG